MRFMLVAKMPHTEFNEMVKDGKAGEKIQRILDALKPETVFFTEMHGQRTFVMIVNMENTSQMPFFAEPLFLLFNADVTFHPVMFPEDLQRAGLDELGKKWG